MEFYIEDIKLSIDYIGERVKLTANSESTILSNISSQEAKNMTEKNFEIVKNHYKSSDEKNEIKPYDLNLICLKIVFYYLSTYTLWRKMYSREKNRDLTFLKKDFNSAKTNDIIINYFKEKYPNDFIKKCSILINKPFDELIIYINNREDFQNMW